MLALLLLAAQSVIGPSGDDDMRSTQTAQPRCRRGDGEEIVVCAPDQEAFRLRALPAPQQTQRLGPAQVRLAPNKTLGVQAQPGTNPAGPAPRAMATVTIDF